MTARKARAKSLSWEGFSWEVIPGRQSASLGGSRPRATVVLDRASQDPSSALKVPASVGRRLISERDDIGCDPGADALRERVATAQEACCRERAERLIMQRDYSSSELSARLGRDGYPQETVDALVGRYVDVGVVDDARFASVFIRSKVSQGWGRARIARELGHRGIQVADVEGWPDEFFEDDERTRALEICRRRSLAKRLSAQSTARFLASRGFSEGVAVSVARQVAREAKQEQAQDQSPDDLA